MSRLDHVAINHNTEFTANVTVNDITITFERIRSHISEVIGYNEQTNIIDKDLYLFVDKLFQEISLKSTIRGRTLLIFNQGLHIQNTANTDKIIGYISSKLIHFAKSHLDRCYVMFRETSAQHFATLPGGEYVHLEEAPLNHVGPGEFCCDNNHSEAAVQNSNWRNRKFLYHLSREDVSWNSYIEWLPFYNLTSQLFDIHIEVHLNSVVDCTHFAYLPFLFAPLWYNIEAGILRLLNSKYRNISQELSMESFSFPMLVKRR